MSEPIIEYRGELNVMDFASRYAERVSRVIDEQTLANVEHQLAEYGYVRVVRCRDCKHLNKLSREHEVYECYLTYMGVTLDGYCAWAEREEGGDEL